MACLTPAMLGCVMREETILLEIKLATLQHYIETVYTYKEVGVVQFYFCKELGPRRTKLALLLIKIMKYGIVQLLFQE